jgi:predicted DNA-binding protein
LKTKQQTKRINVTFEVSDYEQIRNLAHKEGRTMSEIVREAAIDNLTVRINAENIDMITHIIREQLRDILKPDIERLAALSAKTCVQSSTAAYLTAETISKFVPLQEQEEFRECYEKARKKGVEYTRRKLGSDNMTLN